ncbi:uncharacterized protein LOC110455094 [Mizuhopecten yessoensis]|uniref:uncharacterized protein LOC110455094 n=1 Tax=Mizuhopecten yessoensis TaxID=6573 RepID=UPI000B457F77|nr:uncharacterized protein LOC110455094 [Mizuhopecten yessoensis]
MAADYLAVIFRVSVTVFVFVFVFVTKVQQQELPERTIDVSACYSDPNAIRANCSSTEMIAVDEVNAGAKLINTSCMSASTIVNLANPDCCERDNANDCYTPYLNQNADLTYRYHEECTGQEACGPIQVQWMRIPESCKKNTRYRNFTGYLDIHYYCIKNTSVGVLPDVSLTSGSDSALYLQGQQYPAYMVQSTSVSCSIEMTRGCGISVQAIHINFDKVGGVCQQNITISDLSGHTENITCDDNNNYTITKMYRTSSNYATLDISSMQGSAQFWIGFIPDSGGSLSLSCPAVPRPVDTPCDVSSEKRKSEAADTGGGKWRLFYHVTWRWLFRLCVLQSYFLFGAAMDCYVIGLCEKITSFSQNMMTLLSQINDVTIKTCSLEKITLQYAKTELQNEKRLVLMNGNQCILNLDTP